MGSELGVRMRLGLKSPPSTHNLSPSQISHPERPRA